MVLRGKNDRANVMITEKSQARIGAKEHRAGVCGKSFYCSTLQLYY